jgi:hypothetical protein
MKELSSLCFGSHTGVLGLAFAFVVIYTFAFGCAGDNFRIGYMLHPNYKPRLASAHELPGFNK